MRLEKAVRDADPVVVTTSSNVRGGRGKIDGLPDRKASSLPPPPPPPKPPLSYVLPEEILKFSHEFL